MRASLGGEAPHEGFVWHLPCRQLLSLTLDGLTGVSQDHMRAHYQTGSNHMMLNVNLWSTLFLGAGKERPALGHPLGIAATHCSKQGPGTCLAESFMVGSGRGVGWLW